MKECGNLWEMADPEWLAIGAIIIGNIVGWVKSYNHATRNEARRSGILAAKIDDLSERVGRVERRIDEILLRDER